MPRSTLEQSTFDSIEKVIRLYDDSVDDHYKIHHLTNAISLLSSLRTFLEEKSRLIGKPRGEQSAEVHVNINQSQDSKE